MKEIAIKQALTPNEIRANALYAFLKSQTGYVTKEQMCWYLGWDYNKSNDRVIREVISILAKIKPIISTSDTRGYKLAQTADDLESVNHTWAEHTKRADEIMSRCKPLIEFIAKH